MKRLFILVMFGLLLSVTSFSQSNDKTLTKVLKLVIPREGGANAGSVVWHPIQKKYYAAMAGNIAFCMGVFDVKGKLLSAASQETLFDVRGPWYNPVTKTIQMNGYADFGWGEYRLNTKGIPASVKTLFDEQHQPGEQTAGAFDPKKKRVYFLDEEGKAQGFSLKTGEYDTSIVLHLGIREEEAGMEEEESLLIDIADYNSTTLVYTGIKGQEIGLLNVTEKQIELYNEKTGYLIRKLILPEGAPVNEWLNFAYTNNIFFLFDTEARVWYGYK